MKFLSLSIIIFLCCFPVFSQDYRDIVRQSETQTFGSARFQSMAGAFGALGADLSTAAINPAGFGRYSTSTFGLSFQKNSMSNKSVFNGTTTNSSTSNFLLNHAGLVLTTDASEQNQGWVYKQFGFTYNRIQQFDDDITYRGTQFLSLLDEFCNRASGVAEGDLGTYFPFSSSLAYETYAIDPIGGSQNEYQARLGTSNVNHRRFIISDGGISEYNTTFSGNYMNRLYIGGNIGFRTTRYEEDFYHHEVVVNPSQSLDSFDYEYHLKTKGTGWNFKLGAIYLPSEQIRIGLSLHSRSFMNLTDDFSADMTSYHGDTIYTIADQYKPVGRYRYRLRTAPKAVLSFAYVFGTKGCVNADLDFVPYSMGRFRTTNDSTYEPYDYEAENLDVKSNLRSVLNLRLGGEYVVFGRIYLRGGVALYPSSYKQDFSKSSPAKMYSTGIGIKWKKSTVDVAFTLDTRKYNYYAFADSETQINAKRLGFCFNYNVNF